MAIDPPPHPTRYAPATQQLVLEIYVSSIPKSTSFYTSLGFKLDWHVEGYFACLSWDGCLLFLKAGQPRGPAGNVRVMVPDVDAKYAECVAAGHKVVQEIGDRKFVLRDFVVADPDGFEVRFGSFLAGRGRREQYGPDDDVVILGT